MSTDADMGRGDNSVDFEGAIYAVHDTLGSSLPVKKVEDGEQEETICL